MFVRRGPPGISGVQVAGGDVGVRFVEPEEPAARHAGPVEDALLHEVDVRASGDVLEDDAQEHVGRVAVLPRLAGRPVRRQVAEQRQEVDRSEHAVAGPVDPERAVVLEVERAVLVLLGVVGDPRRVQQQVAEGDVGMQRRRPRLGREEVHDPVGEGQRPGVHLVGHRDSREHLGDRRDAEPRRRGHRYAGRAVREAVATLEEDLAAPRQQHRPRHVAVGRLVGQPARRGPARPWSPRSR